MKLADPRTEEGRALLEEQFLTLGKQIPVMYAMLLFNASFMSFAAYSSVPKTLSLVVPGCLFAAVIMRTSLWLRRKTTPSAAAIRHQLSITIALAVVLSCAFGGWGMLMYGHVGPTEKACIALFVFMSAISCSYCLQCLPQAGNVLLFGGLPVIGRLLFDDDLLLLGIGCALFLVLVLVRRMLLEQSRKFADVILSRSRLAQSREELILERERAREAEEQAHVMAYHDPLTGLPNRRALAERLDLLVAATKADHLAALMMVDLDHFKGVNDVHGHLAGDRLLRLVAQRLKEEVGSDGTIYRLGGDEFALVVECRTGDTDRLRSIARKIVRSLETPFAEDVLVHHVGASVGVATFPADAPDAETLVRHADIALYRAKETGRGQHRSFEPGMDAEIRRRAEIECGLRDAIAADELRPFYQPLVNLATREVVGFEMLARWPRTEGDEIPPELFVPIAEESGLINDLMLQLLERACRETRTWDPALTIALNISPVQLRDPWLSHKVLAVLSRNGFPPQRLAVEITENALICDEDAACRTVESFKNQGIAVGLDDFGTGYSSLQHLRALPFDKIKIDRSFVQTIDDDPEAMKIVRAILGLAQTLDLPVIAEGVESAGVAVRLLELGCAEAQGFYFGKPMPGEMISAALADETEPGFGTNSVGERKLSVA